MPEEKIGTKVELDMTSYLGDLAKLGTAWQRYLDLLDKTYPTAEKVNKALKVTTDRIKELRFSTKRLTKEQREELAALRRRAAGLGDLAAGYKKTEQAQKRQQRVIEGTTRAQDRQTRSITRNLKKMLLWGIGAASAYRMFMQIRRALQETLRELYENTEEYKALTAATDKFKISLLSVLGTEEDVLALMDRTTAALNKMADGFNQSMASIRGFIAFQRELAQVEPAQETWLDKIGRYGALRPIVRWVQGIRDADKVTDAAKAGLDAYGASIQSYEEQARKAADASEEMKSAMGDLVSLSQKWTEALSTHAEKQQEVTSQYTANVQVIQAQYYQKLFNADRKYNKAVDKINTDALKSREKAYANYAKQLAAAQRRARQAERNDAARHALEMEFARRRYNLSRIQSERMYQYQRGMLVAEGDVLAIEDLDARYELERQAQEENFKLQMEQAEAMYRLQQRIQRETNREQMAMLRAALNEQLQAIEESRRERLDEAKATHTEEKAEASTWAGEQIADEYTRQQKLLEQNDEYLENVRKKTAEGLAKIAEEHDVGWINIYGVWSSTVGPDGELDRLGQTFYGRQAALAKRFGDAWIQQIQLVQRAAAAGLYLPVTTRGLPGDGGGAYGRRGRTRQYGGKDIVTSPTWFLAGERNQPEQVTVQPLSPIGGGALTLGWRGGPIPLQGQGLEGADLGKLGDSITQGIMTEVRGSILSYRGQRGS